MTKKGTSPDMSNKAVRISRKNVDAFRLFRHHLSIRERTASPASIADHMAGAQAQVLSAAQISIWTRARETSIQSVDSALWKDRTLVRAWCMRRTLFLLPSEELAVFVRGTGRRADYNLQWAMRRVSSKQALDKLLDRVLEILGVPRTRNDLAQTLTKSYGYKLRSKRGGGWGDRRSVACVEVGGLSLPIGFLLHMMGAQNVICSGPNAGTESTYVRADKWIPHWKDLPRERAEHELLVKYLKSYAPATLADFALWAGMYIRDAKPIWEREVQNISQVEIDGSNASILQSDLQDLEKAKVDETIVRLLPFFDSYLLGHKSHRNIVDQANHRKIYRSQGWVSPVLLVNGRAQGVWSYTQKKDSLEVRVSPFSKLPSEISKMVQEEASHLGRFLDCSSVMTMIA